MTKLKRVAVIGAGPGGLAASKALELENGAFKVDVYERKQSIGGAWYYEGDVKSSWGPSVPSIDPNGSDVLLSSGKPGQVYVSPLYKHMETNIIDTLMEFKDFPFEPRTKQFRMRSEILSYLEKYAHTIGKPVSFFLNTNVKRSYKVDSQWILEVEDLTRSETRSEKYDFLVIANGHNEHPYVPDVPGLQKWSDTDRQSITHAKFYNTPQPYKDKNVLVVGNYASGGDLATQIGVVAKKVFVSTTAEPIPDSNFDQILYYPIIESYDVETRSATTKGGQVIKGIDMIVFCTGYLYSLPFLEDYIKGITDGKYVKDLYRQMFYINDPTLAFVGLNKFVSPFPLSESQAAVIARVFSGRIQLPNAEFLHKSYEAEAATKGLGRTFHNLIDSDYTYCNELYEWIIHTKTENEGMVPKYWDKGSIQDRIHAPVLKKTRFDFVKENAQVLRENGKDFGFPDTWL